MDEISMENLVGAGFDRDSWPEDLAEPGVANIRGRSLEGQQELYRYQVAVADDAYAMEVVLDRATAPDPAEGVTFMLNQFAYLWRTDKPKIQCAPDGACRRIHF
jgi:hypothetical protein